MSEWREFWIIKNSKQPDYAYTKPGPYTLHVIEHGALIEAEAEIAKWKKAYEVYEKNFQMKGKEATDYFNLRNEANEKLIEAEERIAKLVETMLDVAKVLDGIKSSDDFTTVYWARDQLEVSAEHIAELSKAQGETK